MDKLWLILAFIGGTVWAFVRIRDIQTETIQRAQALQDKVLEELRKRSELHEKKLEKAAADYNAAVERDSDVLRKYGIDPSKIARSRSPAENPDPAK